MLRCSQIETVHGCNNTHVEEEEEKREDKLNIEHVEKVVQIKNAEEE